MSLLKFMRRFFIIFVFPVFLWGTTADTGFGQFMVKDPKTDEALPMWQLDGYGPFGARSFGKPITPTYPNSRFEGSGAAFGANGEFLGYDINAPNARFQPYWNQEPFEALDYFPARSVKRTGPSLAESTRRNNPPLIADLGGPQIRVAPRPGSSMLSIPPGRAAEEVLQRPGTGNITDERWFRDRPGGGNPAGSPGGEFSPIPGTVPGAVGPARAIGGNDFRPQPVPTTPQNSGQPIPQAAINQSRIRMAESQLEEALIRSSVVHPLSPIEVVISNGTATVRGVVPNQAAKTEAETIILANPAVNAVNNRLSILNETPAQ